MTAVVPCSGLEWRQLVREQIEAHGLSGPEAHLLTVLGDRASRWGTIELGVPLLARQQRVSESQVHRRLAALTRRGLLRTRQRGRGRIALRELVAAPEPEQLSLFDDQPGMAAAAAAAPARVEEPAPVAPWSAPTAASGEPCPRTDAPKPSHQREAAVGGQRINGGENARCAREPQPDHVVEEDGPLQPRLPEVLAILDASPGLLVEPLAVDSALAGFPERHGHDHLQAAYVVQSWAREGGMRSGAANRLLMAALRQQREMALRSSTPRPRHDGRSRRMTTVTEPARYMRED